MSAPEVSPDQGRCPNCGAEVATSHCGHCGQAQSEPLLTVAAWIREAFEEVTSLDGRLVRSVGLLLVHPGRLDLEWRRGRRKSYVSPTRLYVVSAALFFLVSTVAPAPGALLSTGRPSQGALLDMVQRVVAVASADGAESTTIGVGGQDLRALQEKAARWMSASFKWVMILGMVPALAFAR